MKTRTIKEFDNREIDKSFNIPSLVMDFSVSMFDSFDCVYTYASNSSIISPAVFTIDWHAMLCQRSFRSKVIIWTYR